jgi:filamentous hemagglutinin family protein
MPMGSAVNLARLGSSTALTGTLARTSLLAVFGLISIVAPSTPLRALPQGGVVVDGSAQIIILSPTEMQVLQQSNKVVIDWASFNIGANESVKFLQGNSLAETLNRITGGGVSQILGQLQADGKLVISNANGILFGANAKVDVASLIATAASIKNADFMAGNLKFGEAGNASASVINQGTITAAQGGLIALVAPGVANQGIINARLGKVALASGNTFTVDFYGDRLISIAVDDKVIQRAIGADGQLLDAMVANSGQINAAGGVVQMTANAARDVVS